MDELIIKLTLDDCNRILNVLSKEPYREVYDLIDTIMSQGNAQRENKKK